VGMVIVLVLLMIGALELVFQGAQSLFIRLTGLRWLLLAGF